MLVFREVAHILHGCHILSSDIGNAPGHVRRVSEEMATTTGQDHRMVQ
jgi:hypothetical protein